MILLIFLFLMNSIFRYKYMNINENVDIWGKADIMVRAQHTLTSTDPTRTPTTRHHQYYYTYPIHGTRP
jgi:hypothetical protein